MMATPEFQVRKTEIIKLQNVDIVINRRQTEIDDLELQQLADKIVLEHRSDPTQDVFSNWYMTTTGTDKRSTFMITGMRLEILMKDSFYSTRQRINCI